MNTYLPKNRSFRLAAITTFILLMFATILLATPAGRAWAQQIWQFFSHAESDTRTFPQVSEVQPEASLANSLPTPTLVSLENCGSWAKPLCTQAQAQEQVDYKLKQFPDLPEGVHFEGAYVEEGTVLLRYLHGLDLIQMPTENVLKDKTEVGASATIEKVQIGAYQGEYVQGVWFGGRYDPQITWQSDADIRTLQWEEDGTLYSIQTIGTMWTKESLVELAQSLIAKPSVERATPDNPTFVDETALDPTHLTSITEAEALVGYQVRALDPIPPGYIFHFASVDKATKSVCLHYMFTGNDGPGPYLLIGQGPADLVPGFTSPDPYGIEPVEIGGADVGTGFHGTFMQREDDWACSQAETIGPASLSLTWQAEGKQFDIYAVPVGCIFSEGFTTLDLLRLAESLTGVSTHTEGELDPECLSNIADAEKLAGFDVKEAGWIPDGLTLGGASFGNWAKNPTVEFFYNKSGQPHPAIIISESPINPDRGNDLASQYRDLPSGGYELFHIDDQPAVIIRGTWLKNENGERYWYDQGVAETLYMEKDGLLIYITGPWFADDGEDSKGVLTAFAESFK